MFRPLALLLLTSPALAQPLPEMATDRPDFTESPVTVPVGHVQVEGGLTTTRATSETAWGGPELLVRYTPIPRVELRAGVPDYTITQDERGFGDPSVGVKVAFGPVGAWDVAAIGTVAVADDLTPELLLAAGRDLHPRLSLGVQATGAWDGDAFRPGATLVLGTGLTERLGAFLELAVSDVGAAAVVLHHGYTFALSPSVQLDLHGGVGLTDAAPDGFIGAGFGVRR